MKQKHVFIAGTALVAVLLGVLVSTIYVGSHNDGGDNKGYLITPNDFENLMSEGDVFVINAHSPYDGEIEGTDLLADNWESIDSYADVLPRDKSTKIAVYCRSGRMSAVTATQLRDLGYSEVYDLEGGMNSWTSSGGSLVNTLGFGEGLV